MEVSGMLQFAAVTLVDTAASSKLCKQPLVLCSRLTQDLADFIA